MSKNAYDEFMSNKKKKGKGRCFTIKEILSSEYYKKYCKNEKVILIDPKSEMEMALGKIL